MDTPDPAHQQAAREMWQSQQLQGEQLERSLTRALAPEYWKALVPGLSVGEESAGELSDLAPLDSETTAEASRRFAEEGYLQLSPVLPLTVAERMSGAVGTLDAADWPPVFGWLYDEFWRVSRIPRLTSLFASILGSGYRQTPYVWTHVVPGRRGASGWPPHVDSRHTSLRLTVWIALTDATLETGCMCLVPRPLMPPGATALLYDRDALPAREALALLHGSRPLPARAGSVLAWDAGLLHWGSTRQTAGNPRVSLAMELVPPTADRAIFAHAIPPTTASLPTHDERLRIVARAIGLYARNEPRAARYLPLAERLMTQLGRPGF